MPRPGGRPPKDPEQLRSVLVGVRLTAAEAADLASRAAAVGMQPGVYLRVSCLSKDPPRPVPPINRTAWEQLSRLAANLNQLAHHANLGNEVGVSSSELEHIARLVAYLRRELRPDP
jgi:hypothetical protein